MTLVVAYCADDICFMVGDTLVTHAHFELKGDVGPVDGEFHSLKIQILSPELAVGFAGDFDAAYEAVRNLQLVVSAHPAVDPVQWLIARSGIENCEFLVLINREREKQLYHVASNQVRKCQRAYLGNPSDYARYTELRKPYAGPQARNIKDADGKPLQVQVTNGEREFDVASDAMEALCRENVGKKYTTVGAVSGFVTRIVDARISGALEYMQSVEASSFPWEPAGGYTVLADNSKARGVGIYFRAGGRGFIFPVGAREPCISSCAENLAAFIREAAEKYGMRLEGGTWV